MHRNDVTSRSRGAVAAFFFIAFPLLLLLFQSLHGAFCVCLNALRFTQFNCILWIKWIKLHETALVSNPCAATACAAVVAGRCFVIKQQNIRRKTNTLRARFMVDWSSHFTAFGHIYLLSIAASQIVSLQLCVQLANTCGRHILCSLRHWLLPGAVLYFRFANWKHRRAHAKYTALRLTSLLPHSSCLDKIKALCVCVWCALFQLWHGTSWGRGSQQRLMDAVGSAFRNRKKKNNQPQ